MSSISIHQPQYLPWHNYFKKMKKADIFIILDTVDFQKNGLQNRNQIKTSNGVNWLTVPVLKKKGQKIYETKIDFIILCFGIVSNLAGSKSNCL